jgi:hypothetical protein
VAHPSYDSGTNGYDFAVLILEETTTIDITLLHLNNNNDLPPPESRTHVLGWGVTDDGSFADELLIVDLAVISNEDCNNGELGEDNCNGQIFDDILKLRDRMHARGIQVRLLQTFP